MAYGAISTDELIAECHILLDGTREASARVRVSSYIEPRRSAVPPSEPEPPISEGRAADETQPDKSPEKRRPRALKIISELLLYVILAAAILAAFSYGAKPGTHNFLGFSYANVLTRSMQSEIPQGSLVLVRHVDPGEIKVGDDITYLREDNSTVTHKVMTIYENYNLSGQRGFVTKGVDNPDPDPDVVYADNVLGVVMFHVANVGTILSDIAEHIWAIAVIFAALLLLSVTLRIFISESRRENAQKKKKLKHTRTNTA